MARPSWCPLSDDNLPEQPETDISATPSRRKRRHDVEYNAAPRKKPGRKPKARFDSQLSSPIDGYGEPFDVQTANGWTALWVSDRDANRFQRRRWEPARWGDARIVSYQAVLPPEDGKGQIIKSPQKQLTLYVMRTSDFNDMHKHDPNRHLHRNNLHTAAVLQHNAETRANSHTI